MDIFNLIPKGKIWNGKNIRTLFKSIEDGIRRTHDEANKLLLECFPSSSEELFDDWKRICDAKTLDGVLGTLMAVGGNTEGYFELIARKFDNDCQILVNNPQNEFVAGLSSAGMSLGAVSIPKFCVVFRFSLNGPIGEAENLLNKLKPAHVRFMFVYPNLKLNPFVAGKSCAGDTLNYYKELV
jgi:uncharacterized protein YmfQ (DUF2313 family)